MELLEGGYITGTLVMQYHRQWLHAVAVLIVSLFIPGHEWTVQTLWIQDLEPKLANYIAWILKFPFKYLIAIDKNGCLHNIEPIDVWINLSSNGKIRLKATTEFVVKFEITVYNFFLL